MSQAPITEVQAPNPVPQAPNPAPAVTTSGPGWIATTLISISVAAIALIAYERGVRNPRTPKFGTVDVSELFAVNQAKVLKDALTAGSSNLDPGALGQKAAAAMSSQIQAFTKQCDCLLIASPAVFGSTAAVSDYTQTIKEANDLKTSLADLANLGGNSAQVAPPTQPIASAAR